VPTQHKPTTKPRFRFLNKLNWYSILNFTVPVLVPNTINLASEIEALKQVVEQAVMPEALKDKASKMLLRLVRMAQLGGSDKEFESVELYIRTIAQIPWGVYSQDVLDLPTAQLELNKYHYGLNHVKDSILEYLAVMQLQQKNSLATGASADMAKLQGSSTHAPVMCFVGIQGVGKTSIAKSIAKLEV
jgi:ATP-dependent Lon protease